MQEYKLSDFDSPFGRERLVRILNKVDSIHAVHTLNDDKLVQDSHVSVYRGDVLLFVLNDVRFGKFADASLFVEDDKVGLYEAGIYSHGDSFESLDEVSEDKRHQEGLEKAQGRQSIFSRYESQELLRCARQLFLVEEFNKEDPQLWDDLDQESIIEWCDEVIELMRSDSEEGFNQPFRKAFVSEWFGI